MFVSECIYTVVRELCVCPRLGARARDPSTSSHTGDTGYWDGDDAYTVGVGDAANLLLRQDGSMQETPENAVLSC